MQVVGRIRSSYALQVHKVTSGEDVHNFITDPWFLSHVATWIFHVATSNLQVSVTSRRQFSMLSATSRRGSSTSRRGSSTSRRQFYMSLSRRDVDPHVATSIFTLSATSRRGFTRRDVNFYKPLSRRDVAHHVATLPITSRRWFPPSL